MAQHHQKEAVGAMAVVVDSRPTATQAAQTAAGTHSLAGAGGMERREGKGRRRSTASTGDTDDIEQHRGTASTGDTEERCVPNPRDGQRRKGMQAAQGRPPSLHVAKAPLACARHKGGRHHSQVLVLA